MGSPGNLPQPAWIPGDLPQPALSVTHAFHLHTFAHHVWDGICLNVECLPKALVLKKDCYLSATTPTINYNNTIKSTTGPGFFMI